MDPMDQKEATMTNVRQGEMAVGEERKPIALVGTNSNWFVV